MNIKERLRKPLSNWIKFAVWAVIYILFIAWVGNFWWLLLLPFIFDIFITKFIPWSFWKKTKNKTPSGNNCRLHRPKRRESAILFMKYNNDKTLERKKSAKPRQTFQNTPTASSPCNGFAQTEITGIPISVSCLLSTINSAPLKNVPTAVPSRSGPKIPFSNKKIR